MELVYHFEFGQAKEAKIIASEYQTIQTRGVGRASFVTYPWRVRGAGRNAVSGAVYRRGDPPADRDARPAGDADAGPNRHVNARTVAGRGGHRADLRAG